jgi:hypothetical protein
MNYKFSLFFCLNQDFSKEDKNCQVFFTAKFAKTLPQKNVGKRHAASLLFRYFRVGGNRIIIYSFTN